MKEPKDINDYSQCVQYYNERLWIFCIECDNWHKVIISCEAQIFYNSDLVLAKIRNCRNFNFLCSNCRASIKYLLRDMDMTRLIEDMDIPIGDSNEA